MKTIGQKVIEQVQDGKLREQIRNAIGDLRIRQIQAVQAKKKIRDQVTRLMSGRAQVKMLGQNGNSTDIDVNRIDRSIADKVAEYKMMTDVDYQAKAQENAIEANVPNKKYFWKITNELPPVENTVKMDADFIATVSALDILDPETRRYILTSLDFSEIDTAILPPGETMPQDLATPSDPVHRQPEFDVAFNDSSQAWKDDVQEAIDVSDSVQPQAQALIAQAAEAPDTSLLPGFMKTKTGQFITWGAVILGLRYIFSEDKSV